MRQRRAKVPADRTAHPGRVGSPGPATARSRARLLVAAVVPVWGRVVLAIVLAALLTGAAGLGDVAGYAVIPGVYLALSPPVGRPPHRVGAVALATALIAGIVVVGAELSRWTAAVALGLTLVGFGTGLLVRLGPRAAAMSWPLLMGFAYSAGQPLGDASSGSRGAAVLVALPAYVLAAGVVLLGDQRRPITVGSAAAFAGVARALGLVASGAPGAAAEADGGLLRFRLATARLKDAALPLGRSVDSRAALLLAGCTHRAIAATELLATGPLDGRRRSGIATAARAAGDLAAALARQGSPPPVGPLDSLAAAARADRDLPLATLAGSLVGAVHATDVLQGRVRSLPSGLVGDLPGALARLRSGLRADDPVFRRAVRLGLACGAAGLVAGLLGLGRAYWAVFAVVVILNAPAAQDRRRALMRIGGTALGFALAVPLVALLGGHEPAALAVGLLLLLLGMLAMAVDYAVAVVFITAAVGTLFSIGGEAAEFFSFRVLDNAVGVGVVLLIGVLVFRTRPENWWRSAGRTAVLLADAVESGEPAGRRDELVLQLLRLRAETVEAAALPGSATAPAATWTYLAAAEDLVRILTGPGAEPVGQPELAGRLRALADGSSGTRSQVAVSLADEEVTRMERAATALRAG